METRDILDFEGNKIGELSLPRDTSEEIWAKKLNKYKVAPKTEQETEVSKYETRISSRNKIIVEMLVECERRVREQIWTPEEFELFLQEDDVKVILDSIHLLSFDLAIKQITVMDAAQSDADLKKRWIEIVRGYA